MLERSVDLLLVEDDDALREVLTVILTRAGYAVRTAKDGFGALRAIRERVPKILLSDLYMPGMSGFELLYVVCVLFPSIRSVAMSGAYSGTDVPQGVDAEAFYEKGTNPRHLLQALARLQEDAKGEPAAGASERTIWVTRNGYDSKGEGYALLACPECLRAFPILMGAADAGLRRTACQHCLHQIGYRTVQDAGPAAKPIFLTSLKKTLPESIH